MAKKKIFISYSHDGKGRLNALVKDLHDDGHEAWSAPRLNGGQDWWNNILCEIGRCDIFLAALTHDFLYSEACQKELNYALLLQKSLLPVQLSETVLPNALPRGLAALRKRQWSTTATGTNKPSRTCSRLSKIYRKRRRSIGCHPRHGLLVIS